MMHALLVYGTLLRGEPNHRMMKGARFVRRARTEPRFTLIDLGPFPALLEGGETPVSGEVYEVSEEHLARLDLFEGVPRLYRRIALRLDGGGGVDGYVQGGTPRRSGAVIVSGDWRGYRKELGHANSIAE